VQGGGVAEPDFLKFGLICFVICLIYSGFAIFGVDKHIEQNEKSIDFWRFGAGWSLFE
jgi:hypothetical protein